MSLGLRSDIAICLSLMGAGLLTFYTSDIMVPYDMTKYMSYALNLSQGNGYVDFDGQQSTTRGP